MTDITLTDTQAAAVRKVKAWWDQCQTEIEAGLKLSQQVFRLFGYAGVGKSTILEIALQEIKATAMPRIDGKTVEDRERQRETIRAMSYGNLLVMAMAFTGKAALVMTRKGVPASTIASSIYIPMEPTEEEIEKAKAALALLRETGPTEAVPIELWTALVRDREMQLRQMHEATWILNHDSLVQDAGLIVLDEVSMVDVETGGDLKSFGKPILVLGDPGQLPPIKGEGAFTSQEPDVMLTEVLRQAAESPIIRLATTARHMLPIPYGQFSPEVWKVQRDRYHPAQLLGCDQVICGLNATRIGLNNGMKSAAGFAEPVPVGGEKIICLKNQRADGLINGQFLTLSAVRDVKEFTFIANVATEDGGEVGEKSVYRGHFDDHVRLDKERGQRDKFKKKGRVECVWGYAITGHKSQGSQWANVAIWDDGFGRTPEDRARWLYTAITRAESGLLILG